MSWKASKAQLFDPVFANKFITGSVVFQSTFLFIMMFIQMLFAVSSEALICANLEHEILIEFPYISVVVLIEGTVIISLGLSFDILLFYFMRERNVQLIPWKALQDDPSIPMKATLVSTVTMIVAYICWSMLMYRRKYSPEKNKTKDCVLVQNASLAIKIKVLTLEGLFKLD